MKTIYWILIIVALIVIAVIAYIYLSGGTLKGILRDDSADRRALVIGTIKQKWINDCKAKRDSTQYLAEYRNTCEQEYEINQTEQPL